MAPAVLGVGIDASSALLPDSQREAVAKGLQGMQSDMEASPYDWERFYVEPDVDFSLVINKLRERKWDVVMVGAGLRVIPQATVFFEKVVNAVHRELPGARIAFNESLSAAPAAIKRALELEF